MLLTGSMRVLYPILISSAFIEVAHGVACRDNWLEYCLRFDAKSDSCTQNYYIRNNCPATCGICRRRTSPSTSTVTTSVTSSPPATASTKVASSPTTPSSTTLHCEGGQFGINCEYSCHCKNDAVCDKKTGSCPSGCDLGWSGEACQLGNAAYNKTAITTSSDGIVDAGRAVDRHDGSCLYMHSENNQWLIVDLEHRQVLFNLTIVTRDCYQCAAKIFIKDTNVSSTPYKLCSSFYANNPEPESHKVVCNKPVIGRYLFIQLEYSDDRMRICDVRVHAYQYKDCPYSEYGPNCNLECQCKNATEKCDVITGSCPVSGCNILHSGEDCQSETFSTPDTTTLTTTASSPATITTTSTTTTVSTTATTATTTATSTAAATTATTVASTSTTTTRLTTAVDSTPTTIEHTSTVSTIEGPSLPINITLTTQPAGLGKQAIVRVTWKASPSNEECKFNMKYNVKFTTTATTKGLVEYYVNATDELLSEWADASANSLILVSVQSLNCSNYPCKSSEWSNASSITSSNKYPGPVKNMQVTQRTPTSLTLKWDPNEDDRDLFDYKVSYGESPISNGNHNEVTLRKLKPGSEYLISVTPRNEVGFGEPKSIKAWTDIEDPSPPKPPILMEDMTTANSISVQLFPASQSNGARIIGYVLKLMVANTCFRKREKPDGRCCTVNDAGLQVDFNSKNTVIRFGADEVAPGKQVAMEVEADTKYVICYGVEVRGQHNATKTKYTEMGSIIEAHQQVIINSGKDSSSGPYVTVGVSLAASLLLISTVAAVIVVIVRRKSRPKVVADPEVEDVELAPTCHSDFFDHLSRHSGQNQVLALLGHRMDLEQFLTCVRQMRQEGGALFTEEYQLICSGQGSHPTEVARANMNKNRYQNVLSYDHSRVILQMDDPVESDYINANFIKDHEGKVAYIATQGPKATTASDFWLMVWQQEVVEIVMLAKVVEEGRAKCHKYWPDVSETDSFDFDLTVTCLDEIEMQGFTIRRLQVQRGDVVREIQQFHYMAWPDHGVPTETHSLLAMMKHVGQIEVDAPMLVHCSAGVGRTGTFFAIREILMQGQAEGAVDIMKFVLQMRQSRPSMVQTKDQYIYIYTTIGDYLQHRKTAIDPYRLHQHYKELQQPMVADDGFTTTGLDEEFEVLESMTNRVPERKLRHALSEANKEKNRHPGVLPNFDHAVKLTAPGQCSDYINAVYVDGYMLPRAFIVTQIPMANTTDDFWNMVNECGATVLVQMTEDPELKQQNGSSYLPTNEDDLLVGTLRVQLHSIQSTSPPMEEIICRKLVCGHPTKNTVEITHYSFASYPPSPVAISVILGELDNKSQFMSKGPVVSLCQDGAGWSGVLCACHHICKQMQLDETVNVLQCIHRIRTSRPQLVWTKEQYDFCYKVALKFLDSFVVYENLK
ncbi:receptor-type tyrosine-protein phosphatase F-like isoform X2 [Lineus longissimus]|uniref:receptor-type tyrosine-protein phosphatase F-like isoform X2 n=1 Tax=Lineus longissimus TaxID=88925 RepID=UPI00315CBA1B